MLENHPEAYRPPNSTSHRQLRREKRRQEIENATNEDIRKTKAVGLILSMLDNANIAPFTLEAITPVTAFRRLMLRKKGQTVPASTWQVREKLYDGLSVPVKYKKYLGEYLQIERVEGHYLPPNHNGYTRAMLTDGRVGKIIKPADKPRTYTTSGPGDETVELAQMNDLFSNRNCDAVWAPSLVHVSKLYPFEIESLADALGYLTSTDP